MTSPRKRYLELITLAKQFVHQSEKKTLFVDLDLKTYFKPQSVQPIFIQQPQAVIQSLELPTPNHSTSNPVTSSHLKSHSLPNHLRENKQTAPQNYTVAPPLKIPMDAKQSDVLQTSFSEKNAPNEVKSQKEALPSKSAVLFKPEAPLISPATFEKQGFASFFKTHFPHILLREQPLCDSQAKLKKNQWKLDQEITPVIILSKNHNPMEIQFLENLARAITVRFAPAKLIFLDKVEKDQKWSELFSTPAIQLIFSCSDYLYAQPELMEMYREEKDKENLFLNQIPLILLSNLNMYFKDPQLKSSLWRKICYEFALFKQQKRVSK